MSSESSPHAKPQVTLEEAMKRTVKATRRWQYAFWILSMLWLATIIGAIISFNLSLERFDRTESHVNQLTSDASGLKTRMEVSQQEVAAEIKRARADIVEVTKQLNEQDYPKKVSELEAQVKALETATGSFRGALIHLETDIADLKKEIEDRAKASRTIVGDVEPDLRAATGAKVRSILPKKSFEVRRLAQGTYRISFDPPFQGTPGIVVTHVLQFDPGTVPGGGTQQYAFVREVTPAYADITLGIGGGGGQPADRPFSFIAVGK